MHRYPTDPYDRIWTGDDRTAPIQDEIGSFNFSVSPASYVRISNATTRLQPASVRKRRRLAKKTLRRRLAAPVRLLQSQPRHVVGSRRRLGRGSSLSAEVDGNVNAVPTFMAYRAREFNKSQATKSYVFSGLDFPGNFQVSNTQGLSAVL